MAFMEKKSQMTHMEHEIHHYKQRDFVSSSSQMAAVLALPDGLAWRVRELGESPFPEDRDNDRNYWKRGRASEREGWVESAGNSSQI